MHADACLHRVRTASCVLVAAVLGGCGPILSVPTRQFEAERRLVTPQTTINHPVCLFDGNGKVLKTLSEHGAGPWRSPDRKTVYFVRFEHAVSKPESGKSVKTIKGKLFRADAFGRNQTEIRLPDGIVPCEVKISPSGKYLAIAAIEGSVPSDQYFLAYAPCSLYIIQPGQPYRKLLDSCCWPGGDEFAWSPTEDRLVLAMAADQSAMVVIASLLANRASSIQPNGGDPTATGHSSGKICSTAQTVPGSTSASSIDLGQFDPLRWMGTDLLMKAPRSAVVGTWSPKAEDVSCHLHLYRPFYAGLNWMSDGRRMLLFSINGQPVALSSAGTANDSSPSFLCHKWDTERGTLERIPLPKPGAFTAIPSPGWGKYLLWVCGNEVYDLILTDDRGRRARPIATGIRTAFHPRWQNDHTVCFINQAEETKHGSDASKPAASLVTVDVRTMKSAERGLQSADAFRASVP